MTTKINDGLTQEERLAKFCIHAADACFREAQNKDVRDKMNYLRIAEENLERARGYGFNVAPQFSKLDQLRNKYSAVR